MTITITIPKIILTVAPYALVSVLAVGAVHLGLKLRREAKTRQIVQNRLAAITERHA